MNLDFTYNLFVCFMTTKRDNGDIANCKGITNDYLYKLQSRLTKIS